MKDAFFDILFSLQDSEGSSEESRIGKDASIDKSLLTSCLRSFFSPEEIEWECPSQKKEEKLSEAKFQTPLRDAQTLMSRNVSFSGISFPDISYVCVRWIKVLLLLLSTF